MPHPTITGSAHIRTLVQVIPTIRGTMKSMMRVALGAISRTQQLGGWLTRTVMPKQWSKVPEGSHFIVS